MASSRQESRQAGLKPGGMMRAASRQQLSRQSVRSMSSEAAAALLRDIDDGGDDDFEAAERLLARMASTADDDFDDGGGGAGSDDDFEERAAKDRAAMAELTAAATTAAWSSSSSSTAGGAERRSTASSIFGGTEDTAAESVAYAGTEIVALSSETMLHTAGNGLRLFSAAQQQKAERHMWGLGRFVSAIAANRPSGRIAYAERGFHPTVRVVDLPGFRLVAALRGGAEIDFASLAFSRDGSLLATLGSLPDFTLSVWDVVAETQLVALEGSAAPCTQVSFDPADSTLLCTCGGGRAAFWAVETRNNQHSLVRTDMAARAPAEYRPSTTESIAEWHAQELSDAVAGDIPFTCHAWIPGHRVVCGDAAGSIHVFDAKSGSQEASLSWAVPGLNGTPITAITATRLGLMLGTEAGRLLWANPEARMVLATMKISEATSPISSICAMGRVAVVGTKCGRIAAAPIAVPEAAQLEVSVLSDGLSGSVIGIGILPTHNALCSCDTDGVMRLFNAESMQQVGAPIRLPSPQTALCCGSTTDIFAVGSEAGFVRVFSCKQLPPVLAFRQRIHSKPIRHMEFHPLQLFLAVASEGGHLCILEASSPAMRPVGYIDLGAEITDLAWHIAELQHILLVTLSGGGIQRFVVPTDRREGEGLVLGFRDLKAVATRIRWTATAISIDTANSSQSRQPFWALTDDRGLRRFVMPERGLDPDSLEEGDATQPREEAIGCHEKVARCLLLSPDGAWLVSGGGDGTVQFRRSGAPLRKADVVHAGHDPSTAGVVGLCFSQDSRHLFSAGGRAIIRWAVPGTERPQTEPQQQHSRTTAGAGNPFRGFAVQTIEDTADRAEEKTIFEVWKAGGAPSAGSTSGAEARVTELQQELVVVRTMLEGIGEQNVHGCDDERMTPDEMLLNVGHRDKLRQEGTAQVAALRQSIREENLARDLITERLRREFWDSMEDHAAVVRGFRSRAEVANFPLPKRTPQELLLQNRVVVLRRTELAELRRSGLAQSAAGHYFAGSVRLSRVERELHAPSQQQRKPEATSSSATRPSTSATTEEAEDSGSVGGNGSDVAIPGEQLREKELRALLYHPFDLHSPLRKRTQIQLLRMIVRDVQKQFNEEHSRFLDAKRAAIALIEDRNTRIRELCEQLREKPEIWQPKMDDAERPESVFEIRDSEVTAKKPAQGAGGSSADRTAKTPTGDAEEESAERGLKVMMGGTLDSRSGPSLLEVDEAAEAAADQKPEWYGQREPETDEERKAAKEYEKRAQARKEERQKIRRALETELKKTTAQVDEAVAAFDEKLKQLQAQRTLVDMVVCQEQLLIVRLAAMLVIQDGNTELEAHISKKIELLQRKRDRATAAVSEARARFDAAKSELEAQMQTDRIVEKSFRRDFERSEREELFPALLKAFRSRKEHRKHRHRHRHRHHHRAHAEDESADDGDAFAGMNLADSDPGLGLIQQRDDGVDAEEESLAMPPERPLDIVDDVTWERLLEVRSEKIRAEIAVKRAAAELESERRAYQQAHQRVERLKTQLEEAIEAAAEFRKKQRWDMLNLEMMFRLKQGQIEVEEAPVVTRLEGCVVIESARVEELNTRIRSLSKEKAELLQQIAAAKKVIAKKRWENTGIDMQIQDIQNKTKFLQLMRVTKQLQEFLKSGGEDSQALELATLERRAEHEKRAHEIRVEEIRRKLTKIQAETKAKERDSERLAKELEALRSAVAERNRLHQVQMQGTTQTADATRLEKLHRRERMEATVRAQNEEILRLRALLAAAKQQLTL